MEYQRIINLLHNTPNQPSKFGAKKWVEINDDAPGNAIANFSATDNSASLKLKQKLAGKTAAGGTKKVEIMMPLKYLSNFRRTLEMTSVTCEINLILTWSEKCVI